MAKKTEYTPIPLKTKNLIRLLVATIVMLIFLTSYFQSQWRLERRRYNNLEDKYVRVRMMLGREETQRLIDESYQIE
jgi:hypothetical protein